MFRVFIGLATAVSAGFVIVGSANAGDAKTIRIEPRAFYGATISLEAGVRVFRPLPPTTHMIINPNKTPVNLTIKDVTKRVHSTSRNYFYGHSSSNHGGSVGGFLPFHSKFNRGKGHRSGRRHFRSPGRF